MPAEPHCAGDLVDECEVHIDGRLSDRLVARLGWISRGRPATSIVVITVDGDGLCRFLESCAASGVVVDRVFRRTAAVADQGTSS